MPRNRNPVGDFNTAGQDKCPHCGDYFPEAWSASHVAGCARNPANRLAPPTPPTDDS